MPPGLDTVCCASLAAAKRTGTSGTPGRNSGPPSSGPAAVECGGSGDAGNAPTDGWGGHGTLDDTGKPARACRAAKSQDEDKGGGKKGRGREERKGVPQLEEGDRGKGNKEKARKVEGKKIM